MRSPLREIVDWQALASCIFSHVGFPEVTCAQECSENHLCSRLQARFRRNRRTQVFSTAPDCPYRPEALSNRRERTCALAFPGSRWLTSICVMYLLTCRLLRGDLCAGMFRKSPLRSPVRPFSQEPPRTSFFNRHAQVSSTATDKFLRPSRTARPHRIFQPLRRSRPSGSIGLHAGSYCRWPGSSRSGRMTAGMATGWRIANPPQRTSSATAAEPRLLLDDCGPDFPGPDLQCNVG